MATEWKLYIDEEKIPHFIISENGKDRLPTLEESERGIRILNEEGSTCVRLICQNMECKDRGGWIERTAKDASKHVYACDTCGRPMTR